MLYLMLPVVTKHGRLQHLKSICRNMLFIVQKRMICFEIKCHEKLLELFILTNHDASIALTKTCMSIILKPPFSIGPISVLRLIRSFWYQIKHNYFCVYESLYSQFCAICIILDIAKHFKMIILLKVARFLFFHICNN